MKLSIIVPAHNEEDNIIDVIEKIESAVSGIDYELLVVNDHSADQTALRVEEMRHKYGNLRLVDNTAEKGFANAIRTGFSNAGGEVVIPVMADLCDDLSTIKEMWGKIMDGYDVVCGCRYIRGGRRAGGSRIKGFFSSFAGWSLHLLLGIPTHDIANAFKMYRREVIQAIRIEAVSFEISMEIPLKAYYSGFRITEVPTTWNERTKGKSTFKMFKLFTNYFKVYQWSVLTRVKNIFTRPRKR